VALAEVAMLKFEARPKLSNELQTRHRVQTGFFAK
jgi:hypothetical protein